MQRHIKKRGDCEILQKDLNRIWDWSKKWEMEFNVKICHVMELGKSEKRPSWTYKMGNEETTKVHEEKDLGVILQDSQQSEKHVGKIFRDKHRMVRNIGTAFNYMDKKYDEKDNNLHD